MTSRLVVLASGNGSNFQAILDATRDEPPFDPEPPLDARIVGLVCNVPEAYVLTRAREAGVPIALLTREHGEARGDYDARLAETVAALRPDLVVLAGWMRLLSIRFLAAFPNRVINLHPALPGEFAGTHAIERALAAARESGLQRTGVMVHFVPDEGIDDGPVIATAEVAIHPDDTVESLSERVHTAERTLLVSALRALTSTP